MSRCVEESVLLPTVITHFIDHKADQRKGIKILTGTFIIERENINLLLLLSGNYVSQANINDKRN